MCTINHGAKIQSKTDLQNLTIGIILRQQNSYKQKDIFDLIRYYSKDAKIKIEASDIKQLVYDNLAFLQRTGRVSCMDGVYTPHRVDAIISCSIKN